MTRTRYWLIVGVVVAVAQTTVKTHATGESTNPPPDLVELKNGDRLHGRLVAADSGTDRLALAIPSASAPIAMRLSEVARIVREAAVPESDAEGAALVYLTNGDVLPGRQAPRLQGDRVVLSTSYAGELSILRAMVRRIDLDPPGLAGQGSIVPLDLQRWTVPGGGASEKAWVVDDGGLRAMAPTPLGINLTNMPDSVRIRLRVRSDGRMPAFRIDVGGDASLPQVKGRYLVGFGGDRITLSRTDSEGRESIIERGTGVPDALRGQTSLEIELCIDRVRGEIVLGAGGARLGRWVDPKPLGNMGGGLTIRPQDAGGLRLSRLRLGPWDGGIPAAPEDYSASPAGRVALANGDVYSGTVLSVEDGKVAFRGTHGALSPPLEEVRWLRFGDADAGRARRNKNDVRARFAGNGVITMNLLTVEDGKVRGSSENFGESAFRLEAVREVEFDIYREPAPSPVSVTPARERYFADY